jgi:hypothetical protein
MQLGTPEENMNYDAVFDLACRNVISVWAGLDLAISKKSNLFLDNLVNWNLDSGKTVKNNKYVFWNEIV